MLPQIQASQFQSQGAEVPSPLWLFLFGLVSETHLGISAVFFSIVQIMASHQFWLSLWNMLNFSYICPYTTEFGLKTSFQECV